MTRNNITVIATRDSESGMVIFRSKNEGNVLGACDNDADTILGFVMTQLTPNLNEYRYDPWYLFDRGVKWTVQHNNKLMRYLNMGEK